MKPGNWSLVVCGTTHNISSLEAREPLQIGTEDLADQLGKLRITPLKIR